MNVPPPRHVPVLLGKALELLSPLPGQTIVDCTLGAGGHAQAIARLLGSTGRLIGLDQDEKMLQLAKTQLQGLPVVLTQASFDQLRPVLHQLAIDKVDGILADLGVCTNQLDDPERGFSFQQPGPLDMRLDQAAGQPAGALVNRLSEHQLAEILWQFGGERFSRRIARRIVERRQQAPIATTTDLADIVRRSAPRSKRQTIDPATRTFQALRIAVNDELGALERLLKALPGCLRQGGRAVIISFHSLEDRLVKQAFRQRDLWQELTRKPVQATEEEILENPRARSAKLRAAIRKGEGSEERIQK